MLEEVRWKRRRRKSSGRSLNMKEFLKRFIDQLGQIAAALVYYTSVWKDKNSLFRLFMQSIPDPQRHRQRRHHFTPELLKGVEEKGHCHCESDTSCRTWNMPSL